MQTVHERGSGTVAVVGLSCRFPRAADPAAFWRLLGAAEDAIGALPDDRWRVDADGLPPALRVGGFLDDVTSFDPDFFGVPPVESEQLDPQQQLALELAWEALEDAGIVPERLRDSAVAVIAGAMANDAALDQRDHGRYALTGSQPALIANRISHLLGLRGLSLTVNSGQSSSLLAVHLAAQELLTGRANLALALGVQLNLSPVPARMAEAFGVLSADGMCYTFDERANGYVRGEGGACVVLKRLDHARADGDAILGIISGSAANNDGAAGALAVPNVAGQEAVLRAAYAMAGTEPGEVDYVELHGTGTAVGDPVEAAALGSVLGACAARRSPLLVGSVKTNIGHLEGAAGIAGLVKVLLMMQHRQIPASLNFVRGNPSIRFAEWNLTVVAETRPWRVDGTPATAGVSSFGIGGTNCHLVVTTPPEPGPGVAADPEREPETASVSWWGFSGRTPTALQDQAKRLVPVCGDADTADVAWSLLTTRSAFGQRAIVLGRQRRELLTGLRAVATGRSVPHALIGTAHPAPKTAVIFTGQGAQRLGMGSILYRQFSAFAAAWDEVAAEIDELADEPLAEVVWGVDAELLRQTRWAQPALFATEVALFRLVESWGITPSYVAGHSLGEITAAHVSGILSLSDAASMVVHRGRLMQSLTGGSMVTVEATESEVRPLLGPGVDIAAVNAAQSVVLSGDAGAVGALAARFAAEGRRVDPLHVSHAFHSSAMDRITEDFAAVLSSVAFGTPRIPVISNVTGTLAAGEDLRTAAYWARHLRQTVRFGDGLRCLLNNGVTAFVEAGPGAVLSSLAGRQTGPRESVVPMLRPGVDEVFTAVEAMGRLWLHGIDIDPDAVAPGRRPRRMRLPTYPFQRRRLSGADATPASTGPGLAASLASAPEAARKQILADLVRDTTAAVLGHAAGATVESDRTFQELGFDSFLVLELAVRLARATGLALTATSVYNHPTTRKLATHLAAELAGTSERDEDAGPVEPAGAAEPRRVWSSPDELFRHLDQALGPGIEPPDC